MNERKKERKIERKIETSPENAFAASFNLQTGHTKQRADRE